MSGVVTFFLMSTGWLQRVAWSWTAPKAHSIHPIGASGFWMALPISVAAEEFIISRALQQVQ